MGQPIEQKENEEVKEEDKEKKIDVRDIFGGKEDHKYWVDDEENPDHRLARVNAANKGFTSSMNHSTGSHVIYKMYTKYIDAIDGKRKPFPFIHEVFDEIQTELQAEGKQLPESVWNDNTRNIIFKKRSNGMIGKSPEMQLADALVIGNNEGLKEENEIEMQTISHQSEESNDVSQISTAL